MSLNEDNFIKDVPPLSDSVWPYDTGNAPDTSPPRLYYKIRCFVLCPFSRAELILMLVRKAADQLIPLLNENYEPIENYKVQVYYAGDFSGPGVIHPDIWSHIRQADIIVADLTGNNPNVLFELGTAAAWRPVHTVIMIRDKCDGNSIAFDLQPSRQLVYDSTTRGWIDQSVDWLRDNMLLSLTQFPLVERVASAAVLPFRFDFGEGHDSSFLWSPGPTHRRLIAGALEFGSIMFFPYSWLSPAGLRVTTVRIKASMRFSLRLGTSAWIGIALRSQGYLASQGFLVWLGSDGVVHRTGPGLSGLGKDEQSLGVLPNFNPDSEEFVDFDVYMTTRIWSISVGDVHVEVPLVDMHHEYTSGRILIQAYKCQAAIKQLEIEDVPT